MDPYKILGIDEGATPQEVSRAYRKMAAKYHPDVGGDAWVFQEVNQAYAILTGRQPKGKSKNKAGADAQSPPQARESESSTRSPDPTKTYSQTQSEQEPETGGAAFAASVRPSPRRRKKTSSMSVHVIGAVFGGVCALGLVYLVLKYQIAPGWASFGKKDPAPSVVEPVAGAPTPTAKSANSPPPVIRRNNSASATKNSGGGSKDSRGDSGPGGVPSLPNVESADPSPIQPAEFAATLTPENEQWLRETLAPEPTEPGTRLPVSALVPELKKWLNEVEIADTKIKKLEAYKQIRKRLDSTLATTPIKLYFRIEDVSEGVNGLYRIGLGECESNLGTEIELLAPKFLEDRISRQLAKEIDLSTYRVEVSGAPDHDTIESLEQAAFFASNFVFFFDHRGMPSEPPILVYLKKPKGRVFKPVSIEFADAVSHVNEFVNVTMPVASAFLPADRSYCVLSAKKELRSEGNLLVVIRNDPTTSFRASLPDEIPKKFLGQTVQVAGQIANPNGRGTVIEVDIPARVRVIDNFEN